MPEGNKEIWKIQRDEMHDVIAKALGNIQSVIFLKAQENSGFNNPCLQPTKLVLGQIVTLSDRLMISCNQKKFWMRRWLGSDHCDYCQMCYHQVVSDRPVEPPRMSSETNLPRRGKPRAKGEARIGVGTNLQRRCYYKRG